MKSRRANVRSTLESCFSKAFPTGDSKSIYVCLRGVVPNEWELEKNGVNVVLTGTTVVLAEFEPDRNTMTLIKRGGEWTDNPQEAAEYISGLLEDWETKSRAEHEKYKEDSRKREVERERRYQEGAALKSRVFSLVETDLKRAVSLALDGQGLTLDFIHPGSMQILCNWDKQTFDAMSPEERDARIKLTLSAAKKALTKAFVKVKEGNISFAFAKKRPYFSALKLQYPYQMLVDGENLYDVLRKMDDFRTMKSASAILTRYLSSK